MSPESTISHTPSEIHFHSGPEAPTKPGVYWFRSETAARAMLVEVHLMDSELTVWWPPREDQPVAKLKGHWRGPVAPYLGQVADSHSMMEN